MRLALAFAALLLGPADADVAEDDDDSSASLVGGDRRCAVGDGKQPSVAAGEVIVLDAERPCRTQRVQ